MSGRKLFLFVYGSYYPLGGANDCEGIFDSLEDLISYTEKEDGLQRWDNVEVFAIADNEFKLLYEVRKLFRSDRHTQYCLVDVHERSIMLKGKKSRHRATTNWYDDWIDTERHINFYEDKADVY